MRVLKFFRRRKPDMGRRLGTKKHLNYSAISNGSGNTDQNISKDDPTDDAFFSALIERETSNASSTTSTVATTSTTGLSPSGPQIVSPISTASDEPPAIFPQATNDIKPIMTTKPKMRQSLEPIAPLGVVVNEGSENEDDWDAISHISGISTRSESSAAKKNLSLEEIKEDLESTAASLVGSPAVVSPDKESDAMDEKCRNGSLVQSVTQNIDGGTENSPIKSSSRAESFPAVTVTSPPPQLSASLEAYFEFKDEQDNPPKIPPIQAIRATSFDSSTATAYTDNTSGFPAQKVETESIFSPKVVREKINALEDSVRSSCQSLSGGTAKLSPKFFSCNSVFSSPSEISSNLKDSFEQIKKELSGLYESSGLASAAAKAEQQMEIIKCPESFLFGTKKGFCKKEEEKKTEEITKHEEAPRPRRNNPLGSSSISGPSLGPKWHLARRRKKKRQKKKRNTMKPILHVISPKQFQSDLVLEMEIEEVTETEEKPIVENDKVCFTRSKSQASF